MCDISVKRSSITCTGGHVQYLSVTFVFGLGWGDYIYIDIYTIITVRAWYEDMVIREHGDSISSVTKKALRYGDGDGKNPFYL